MALKKINPTGKKAYFHQFKRSDGTLFRERTTAQAYFLMGTEGGAKHNPTHPDGEWNLSFETIEYDTPDGAIHKDEYADLGDGTSRVCTADFGAIEVFDVPSNTVAGGVLSLDAADHITTLKAML